MSTSIGVILKAGKKQVEHRPDDIYGLFMGPINQVIDLILYRRIIYALLPNRLTDRYHGSFLGILWSLLNPLLTMVGLAIVFPLIAKFQVGDYPLFLFSGILPWGFINASVLSGGDSIRFSEQLIKKVYVPKIILPYIFVTVEAINMIIALVALGILGIIFGYSLHPRIVYLFFSFVVIYVFCLGIGFITSILVVYFRDIQHITGVMLQTIFYASAIIYPVSVLPPRFQSLMEFNPFFQFIRLFHVAINPTINGGWELFEIPIILALSTFYIGLITQWKFGRQTVFRI